MTLVADTSALAAVIFGEDDAESMLTVLSAHAGDVLISAATMVEAAIVVEAKQGSPALADLRTLLDAVAVIVTPVDREQAEHAIRAWRRFGKGRHPARLNFGDCFAYALAKSSGRPLLFKGEDFTQTDVTSAL